MISVGVRVHHVPLPYVIALLVRAGHRGLAHGHDRDHDHDHDRDRDRVPAHGDTAAGDRRALSRAHDFP